MINNSNLIEQTSEVKTTAVFSKDKKKRYLLRMTWDESKPKACIIMTYPSTADELEIDQTSQLCRNNAVKQGYGEISIVNLFCGLDQSKPESDRTNASVIAEECSRADIVIIAYGRSPMYSEEKKRLLEALQPYSDKLYTIIDSVGNDFCHPLSPKARTWKMAKI